jgi:hypothetical protein
MMQMAVPEMRRSARRFAESSSALPQLHSPLECACAGFAQSVGPPWVKASQLVVARARSAKPVLRRANRRSALGAAHIDAERTRRPGRYPPCIVVRHLDKPLCLMRWAAGLSSAPAPHKLVPRRAQRLQYHSGFGELAFLAPVDPKASEKCRPRHRPGRSTLS